MSINMNQTTKYVIPERCEDCRFFCDTEEETGYCCLFGHDTEKDDDFEPIKLHSCHSSDGVFETRAIEVNVAYDVRPIKQGE